MAIQELCLVSEVETDCLDNLVNYYFCVEKKQKGSVLPNADTILPFIFQINCIPLGNQTSLEKMQTGHIPTELLFR